METLNKIQEDFKELDNILADDETVSNRVAVAFIKSFNSMSDMVSKIEEEQELSKNLQAVIDSFADILNSDTETDLIASRVVLDKKMKTLRDNSNYLYSKIERELKSYKESYNEINND